MINKNEIELSGDVKLSNHSKISITLKISIIVAIILIPPVLLMEHTIKYALYFFSLILTGLIITFIFSRDFEFKFPFPSLRIIDYFLIGTFLIFLVSTFFSNRSIEIPFVLSIIVLFFLLGWVFTRLLGIEKSNLNLSLVVIAFCLSIGLTALLFFFTLITETLSVLPSVFVGIAFLPIINDRLVKHKKNFLEDFKVVKRKQSVFDALVILWIISLFIFFLASVYPELSEVPGRDVVRHVFRTSQQTLTPDIYQSTYPWFHHTWGTVFQLSSPSMSLFQTGISLLAVFLIFSFYIMSKAYLKEIDRRAHLLATIIFSVFSGFGWLYFLKNKLTVELPLELLDSEWFFLRAALEASWWDIGKGEAMWLLMSFRPITIGFILIFVLLYLMKRHDLSKRNFIIVVSFLGLTLGQIHLPEFIFFTVFLFALAILKPKVKLRLKETCLAFFFGTIAFLFVSLMNQNFFGAELPQSSLQWYIIFLPVIAFISFILTLFPKRPKIAIKFNTLIAASIVVFIFAFLLITWFLNSENSAYLDLLPIKAVPWEYYPMLFGLTGIFGILGSIIVLKKYSEHPIIIFVIFMLVGIIFARSLTFLNANVFEIGYFERRIIPIVFVSVAMLAPLLILKLINAKGKMPSLKNTKGMLIVAVLSLIIVGGMFSTFLTFEHQILLAQNNKIRPDENNLIKSLDDVDPYSSILTITKRTMRLAEFGVVGQTLDAQRFKVWDWTTPEMPLNAISSLDSSSLFFLRENDKRQISRTYSDGYLGSHLVNLAPYLKNDNEPNITYLPRLSPPISKSPVILVLPEEKNHFYYAYDFLSLGNYNYTTALLLDIETISTANVLIAPNEEIGLQLMNLRNEYDLKFDRLIIFNLDGYGPLVISSEVLPTTSQELSSALDWETVGLRKGTISIPKLEDHFDPEISHDKLISINVGDGEYRRWSVSHSFEIPRDLSKFEFIKFNWYGNNDQQEYQIMFKSDKKNLIRYQFQDSWNGLKQVVIPTKIVDEKVNVFGVHIRKITIGNATWNNISEIDIRPGSINNKGSFYFNGFFFDDYLSHTYIEDGKKERLHFPGELVINQNILPGNFTVLANYEHDIPFILEKNFKDFKVDYVNVNPIIQKLDEGSEDSRDFYPLLANILEMIDEELPRYEPISKHRFRFQPGGYFTFNNLKADGDLKFSSPSIITKVNSEISVNVDGKDLNYENISLILPVSVEQSSAKATQAVLENGTGFYSRIIMNSPKILFEGDPAIVSLIDKNGNITKIQGQRIQIDLPMSNNLLRQPSIQIDGVAKFEEIMGHGELEKKLRKSAEHLTVEGSVNFTIKFSDEHFFAHNTVIKGKKIFSEPVYTYDEIKNLLTIFTFSNKN